MLLFFSFILSFRLTLQEGLEVGSLEPFIERFRKFNWSVVVMDPRSRSDTTLEGLDDVHVVRIEGVAKDVRV